ncbi:MATE family efflux transporter [Idiomarina tyrosinivorans]|uniref:MATE family efflux transporter n=1 Tax=Idiomarina tyrosinivorans TaxID=1445662 RepID=A0A432ZTM9_9GAMM|nr:MATE family efflux transporter [Idiomarina tyrosinivorans]RUO81146.1 MATE family efflux transporter [Idiomarina tyrosinivorans]
MKRLFGFAVVDHRHVFAIALPMIISNIAAPLLGLVDTAIIGHLPETQYLSAVAIGAMVINVLYFLAVFLRMATTGFIAQAYGAGQLRQQQRYVVHGLTIAAVFGVLLIALQPLIITLAFWLVSPSPALAKLAQDYLNIRLLAAPAALANLVILGALLGRQQSRSAMLLVIITNAVNVLLDVVLIIGLNWNVRGAAWASMWAEWLTCCVGVLWLFRSLKLHWRTLPSLSLSLFKQVLGVNGDIFIRSLVLQLCMATMTGYATRFGETMVAVNAVLMQFLLLISLGLDGIAYAVEALAGQAKGQNRPDRIRYWCRITLLWSLLFACCYAAIFSIAGEQIIRLLTDLPAVIEQAVEYLPWIMVLPIIAHWSYWFDGVYIGLSLSNGMRNTMLAAGLLGFLPTWWLTQSWGNHGLWAALTVFLAMRGISQALWLLPRWQRSF